MGNQSTKSVGNDPNIRLITNTVDALQTLYRSVRERKEREMISEMNKKEIFKKQYEKRIQI
ncbi:hypothetical protein A2334_02475 [Candidatus Roizmanbacteria bacterium RIFOXYB2_FULL_38_10]|uniref:Uncharacterized protein n=1 Tax=Candidatus Roizmanbacteria bacterium RIFOXYD1_FULL_38_12 TaxID=1802093 RepID=A0A1F7L039_9BACT|nr:MAG: hypothetical protein A3K47_01495 [Candidatus Roizmanbacteria bacterium RIFOXYA2_FULL_38_14]OGK63458.1 MAG: hypothetical protein A3K27_01495 [Candidatus Roizmanbacteria bacterium RIFOXYA1_FULL_37_12]OGK65304.1 MAG: hypothetical protein A3K38_01495 [Candidatus Roizmanbacteria bacterium RIFOXYB1_FULL_40_23]OGK67982.1 MAG: hypothetical protein A2334_02475 [Candidatus Roizmanbacteria bacterium RIFOXYB2_FULL_38_10]OGK69709.1 MAG: hypothetical protein A3K21_01500 [Candidatus Roizmanbacteria ba